MLTKNKEKFVVQVEEVMPDYTKYNLAKSMLKYIKSSNSFNDGDESIDVDQYKEVFSMIFDVMNQRQHYDIMMN